MGSSRTVLVAAAAAVVVVVAAAAAAVAGGVEHAGHLLQVDLEMGWESDFVLDLVLGQRRI
jgi:hypothetical protein